MTHLFRNNNGVIKPAQLAFGAASVAIGYNNMLLAVDNQSNVMRFKDGAWSILLCLM
jgi:phosphate-selective porin